MNCPEKPKDPITQNAPLFLLSLNNNRPKGTKVTIPDSLVYTSSEFDATTSSHTAVVGSTSFITTKNSEFFSPQFTTLYTISPSLPKGLSMDRAEGGIRGTPQETNPETSYTITCNYEARPGFVLNKTTLTGVIKITILGSASIPTMLNYSGNLLTSSVRLVAEINSPLIFRNLTSVPGTTVSYSVSPALPAGLSIDTTTGNISGTPTVSQNLINYSVRATYTVLQNFRMSGSNPLTTVVTLYIDSALAISNRTCNYSGVAPGCTTSIPFSCPSSVICSSQRSGCLIGSSCVQ